MRAPTLATNRVDQTSTRRRPLPWPPSCERGPARTAGALHRFLELLGGAEGDFLARLDLDRLAGRRVAAHAGGALAHLQNAEAADADAVALLEVLGHQADKVAEDRLGLLFRHLMGFREIGGEMLQ